eukprot:CAMPEP_0201577222 /NCGR_PEP_ID=MMETSP0190_2-20130828/23498_1 /ASSEMBLY_ACC=CAM_ASM_000263 /TAXON_ID=37353 /ORGANISM="Rosalina sp." /LENGTH=162 /DNA_ID=CAMNT_0048009019 /DNA_START=288 /DNA_END=776 /DNA_ORIENTATION=+
MKVIRDHFTEDRQEVIIQEANQKVQNGIIQEVDDIVTYLVLKLLTQNGVAVGNIAMMLTDVNQGKGQRHIVVAVDHQEVVDVAQNIVVVEVHGEVVDVQRHGTVVMEQNIVMDVRSNMNVVVIHYHQLDVRRNIHVVEEQKIVKDVKRNGIVAKHQVIIQDV